MANDNYVVNDSIATVSKEAGEAEIGGLFNRLKDELIISDDFWKKPELPIQGLKDFPQIDLSGFEQESTYKSKDTVSDLLHGIKHLFVKDESLGEKLKEKVEAEMSPDEKKQFEKEEKALSQYQKRLLAWETQMTINPGPMPLPPDTPMHEEIDRRVEALEKDITETVRKQMSPEDQIRLDKQFKQYKSQSDQARKIQNPLGTGEFFTKHIEPGNAIKDYFDRIKEETERRLKS